MGLRLIITLLIMSCQLFAEETPESVLTIDSRVDRNLSTAFLNDKNIRPMRSDFKIVNYLLMSSESGERWATVTVENTSTGNRTLEKEHIYALFADGKRRSPVKLKQLFQGLQVITLTLYFGDNKFPIISLYGRNSGN